MTLASDEEAPPHSEDANLAAASPDDDVFHQPYETEPLSVSEDEVSEIDPDKMGSDGELFKKLLQRKSNLMKTAEILATHDLVVQKLINKARDDLGKS